MPAPTLVPATSLRRRCGNRTADKHVHSNQRNANGRDSERTVLKRFATSDQEGDDEATKPREPGSRREAERGDASLANSDRPPIPMRSSGRCLCRRQHGTRLAGLAAMRAGVHGRAVLHPSRCLQPSGTGVAKSRAVLTRRRGNAKSRSAQFSLARRCRSPYNPRPATIPNQRRPQHLQT